MNVAFCSSEVFPFAKTGGLADVCGSLPVALSKLNIKVRIFLPKYGCIDEKKFKLKQIHRGLFTCSLKNKIDVYFISNLKYFGRQNLYVHHGKDFADNLERFNYFNLMILKELEGNNFKTDIIHCHDWQTSLVPVYLKNSGPFFSKTKTVLTIHNLAYQGVFETRDFNRIPSLKLYHHHKEFDFYGRKNLLKAGIMHADRITTVSRQYASEILTKDYGCGLEDSLKNRKENLSGIINGLDLDVWNPETDKFIKSKYSKDSVIEGKRVNKKQLQKLTQLPVKDDVPIFSFVGRLDYQKGFDLIIDALKEMMNFNCQVIIQGLGEKKYSDELKKIEAANSEKLSVNIKFDEKLAHSIYAGSDAFLLPSRFEPCGLSQLIAMKYGTIPIVTQTGGLVDTVSDQQGLFMKCFAKKELLDCVNQMISIYEDDKSLMKMIRQCMTEDFSWSRSAVKYKELYQCLLSD